MVAHEVQSPVGLVVETVVGNGTNILSSEASLDNLYPALVQCFGIILLGFVAGKFSFISDVEAKGLGTFVGTFSLPALIFVSLCQLDFTSVNWVFLGAITFAKSTVFFLVLLVGLFTHRPANPSRSALYAIFCTQSNDFALGFPVLNAIYGPSHPKYPMYLYLLAPVSLVLLNPIGFVLLEIGKSQATPGRQSNLKIARKVVLGILKNPLITMTILGIVGNLLFHGSMPSVIHDFMATLGSAFSSSALFLLGLRMVGQVGSSTERPESKISLVTPFILITMKSLVLPILAREAVSQFEAGANANETLDLSNYAFLYGTIPTAPSVFVYATKYNVLSDTIAGAITANTFIAAPLMFVTAKLLTLMNMNPGDYIHELDTFLLDVSGIGLVAAGWVILVLAVGGKARSVPHCLTLTLACFQGMACLGAIMWSLLDCRHGWKLYIQFVLFSYGVFGSRITTAVLAIAMLLLANNSSCNLLRYRPLLLSLATGLPSFLVLGLLLVVALETEQHGDKTDPYFQYGLTQAVVALVVILTALLITLISLILRQRCESKGTPIQILSQEQGERESLLSEEEPQQSCSEQETSVEIEDLVRSRPVAVAGSGRGGCGAGRYRCDSTTRSHCTGLLERYEVPPGEEAVPDQSGVQPLQHTLLLVLLSISMFVGAALCIWTLCMERMSGIYLELVFLDGFLNLGQSIFTFALFGIDAGQLVMRARMLCRRLLYGKEEIRLPAWEDLDSTTRAVSTMFIRHHLATCMEQVLGDQGRWRGVVGGRELVTWLVDRGLTHSRQDGEVFGRHLLRGRVIRHVENHLDFYDDHFLYTFKPFEEPTAE